jgi:hypothetical protein
MKKLPDSEIFPNANCCLILKLFPIDIQVLMGYSYPKHRLIDFHYANVKKVF